MAFNAETPTSIIISRYTDAIPKIADASRVNLLRDAREFIQNLQIGP